MRYRTLKVDAARINDLMRALVPDLPPDAKVAHAVVTCTSGLLLTLHSERFGMVGLLERVPTLGKD